MGFEHRLGIAFDAHEGTNGAVVGLVWAVVHRHVVCTEGRKWQMSISFSLFVWVYVMLKWHGLAQEGQFSWLVLA